MGQGNERELEIALPVRSRGHSELRLETLMRGVKWLVRLSFLSRINDLGRKNVRPELPICSQWPSAGREIFAYYSTSRCNSISTTGLGMAFSASVDAGFDPFRLGLHSPGDPPPAAENSHSSRRRKTGGRQPPSAD